MITLIEAKNYRSLKAISQPMSHFHVLIGANATGKSTFLDVVRFVSDVVNFGIDRAVQERVAHLDELTFGGEGGDIELAVEVALPARIAQKFNGRNYQTIRYEVRFGKTPETLENAIHEERVLLLAPNAKPKPEDSAQPVLFPDYRPRDTTLLLERLTPKSYKRTISKKPNGNDNFYVETYEDSGKGWLPSFRLGIKKSALGNLPDDETKFPASTWLKSFLQEGVQLFVLNSLLIRRPSPPGQGLHFKPDGSNLPWVINNLRKDAKRFAQWLEHIQTVLPDIQDIDTTEREEDKHRYIRVRYKTGIEVPSWLVSDGTLRLLALTIPAYIKSLSGVFLIEEPENGIHPKAIEAVYQSLSSVYEAQVLLASHSPVILSMLEPQALLCFGKTQAGITDIVKGSDHPRLAEWRGNPNLYLLFAGGLLS
jgi:predicted ATPase